QQERALVELREVLVGERRVDDVAEERGVDQAQRAADREADERDREAAAVRAHVAERPPQPLQRAQLFIDTVGTVGTGPRGLGALGKGALGLGSLGHGRGRLAGLGAPEEPGRFGGRGARARRWGTMRAWARG